jgi:hypothetical protein
MNAAGKERCAAGKRCGKERRVGDLDSVQQNGQKIAPVRGDTDA